MSKFDWNALTAKEKRQGKLFGALFFGAWVLACIGQGGAF